ncbi:hydroxymethylglutaryl-CoA reductase [Desertifilum sp. FACHB-1129]|uniref:hydroxymethylglutaryl-CoA reductase (NADPH) n=1 Tax=Desertifilum tharense IPPAS B-1220 TaxID=1781255 RepID=A0A1E5QRK8_9CYAN|nr:MULTISPECIES: hydroxymethylglutaryl-CoA reductase [Desertifilum]MDA0211080.1 hydroxymethylglutaryl-CoA reductase [Cyanobacteria bacterium FC1]MBD2314184.1 hydroxymethylglutaryl-CoA reductase [Desertifilum sp. FACHB-1129]MBD2320149.1 hydroxymethylglutaryl-CoA reductase [Desertifilum sp. FACHB-866]MBD2330277.1 hydroxymethylglutaryl-CoA reductase [Desertifilum sp. FACHB-868]OEJ77256.1 3-hydroxy-3-methylglutaryl-CoA reductase [Desertifilum tharense IPPAS B-1220]
MSTHSHQARNYLASLLETKSLDEFSQQLACNSENLPPKVRTSRRFTISSVEQQWQLLQVSPETQANLLDEQTRSHLASYHHHIENFIGTVKLPVGLAGPLRVNGLFAQGDYYIPLATTEAALVASYSRGAQLISEAGGCSAMVLNEGVNRTPGFAFANLPEVGIFLAWVVNQQDEFKRCAEATTRYGQLKEMRMAVEGNHVYLDFQFTTGDAAGQNMVTIATEAICNYIRDFAPVKPQYAFVEANLSGDKKASVQSFISVRGKKVTAEITLPSELVRKRLHATPEQMVNYWRMSALGGVLSGTIGIQGHYANGLAALYLACGQDVACIAESAVGVTRFELTETGGLYAAVTLPNLMVGTVGGGTGLPSQQACLEILGLAGTGKARAFAEVCASLVLAGELSIIGALASGEFTRAHQRLARGSSKG